MVEEKTELINVEYEKKEKRKKKIPKEISQEIIKDIFKNLLGAIFVMLYFAILNLAYTAMKQERLINDIKVFATSFLVAGIIVIEKAYKKESGKMALLGCELIFLSLHSLSIMHIITLFKYDFRLYLLTSSYIISIYYVLKAIILYTKGRHDYVKGLSDISQIVKKDEPIVKEAKRTQIQTTREEISDEEDDNLGYELEKQLKMRRQKKSLETRAKKRKTKSKIKTKETDNNIKSKTKLKHKENEEKTSTKKETTTKKTSTETKQKNTKKTTKKSTTNEPRETTKRKVKKEKEEEKPKSVKRKTKKEV